MQVPPPICIGCKHFNVEKWNCPAFSGAIPIEVFIGEDSHATTLPNQGNDIVFESAETGDGDG